MWLRVFSMKAAFYDVYDDVVGLKGCTVPFHAKIIYTRLQVQEVSR